MVSLHGENSMTEQQKNGHYRLEDDVHFQDFCTNIWQR